MRVGLDHTDDNNGWNPHRSVSNVHWMITATLQKRNTIAHQDKQQFLLVVLSFFCCEQNQSSKAGGGHFFVSEHFASCAG